MARQPISADSGLADNAPDVEAGIEQSRLFNADLAPVPQSRRKWGMLSFAALWISMSACIPTYMLASSLIGGGMNWWEAVLTIFLGNLIVVVPMILNAHAGTKYGIPFPVLCRASFGTAGANVPALLRALVACGWFDIQAPILIALGLLLLYWAYRNAGGFGPILSQPSAFDPGQPKAGQFWSFFIPGLTGMIGFWATLSLNIPDFSRYARSQRDQVVGQALGLPLAMAFYSFIGVAVTSATAVIYGRTI